MGVGALVTRTTRVADLSEDWGLGEADLVEAGVCCLLPAASLPLLQLLPRRADCPPPCYTSALPFTRQSEPPPPPPTPPPPPLLGALGSYVAAAAAAGPPTPCFCLLLPGGGCTCTGGEVFGTSCGKPFLGALCWLDYTSIICWMTSQIWRARTWAGPPIATSSLWRCLWSRKWSWLHSRRTSRASTSCSRPGAKAPAPSYRMPRASWRISRLRWGVGVGRAG